jgi:hypothetical protein
MTTKYLEKKKIRNRTALPTFGGLLPSVAGVRCRGGSSDSVCIVQPTVFQKKWRNFMTESKIEVINEYDGFPAFRMMGKDYLLLNLGMDVDTGGVIYHLRSEFSGKCDMGEVIDTIELERNQRLTA